MTTPKPEGAPIRDCPDCGQEIHAPAAGAGKASLQAPQKGDDFAAWWCVNAKPLMFRHKSYGVIAEAAWNAAMSLAAAPAEHSDSAAVREALQAELDWLSAEWPPVPRSGVADDWVVWAFGLDQYHRGHMADLRRKIAALASTPAQPYSPKGNFCSICQVHDRWCEHIQSPAAPAQRDAGEKVREIARRIISGLRADAGLIEQDGHSSPGTRLREYAGALEAALLAEGSKP